MFKKVWILSALCLLVACQSEEGGIQEPSTPQQQEPKARVDISLTSAEQLMLEENTDFAFRFFKQVCTTEDEKPNLFISPLSASLCLSMSANGAEGNTLAEIQNAIGFSASLNEMNTYNRKLVSALLDLDNTTKLGIANSIWLRQDFKLMESFVDVNKKMYDAQVERLDFNSSKATDVINNWCAEKTNNCIPKVLNSISPDARMILMNALYFKGTWKEKFSIKDTESKAFTNSNGAEVKVNMMQKSGYFNYAQNDLFEIAEFPYGNEAFSMVVFLPMEGKSLDTGLSHLTGENWIQWQTEMTDRVLSVEMPRFNVEYDKVLNDDLKSLGMKDAFIPTSANFGKISTEESLAISLLKQVTFLSVDEEGTEAAAITGSNIATSPGPDDVVSFTMNRPFIFMIKEKSTGAILFMGKITKL